MFAVLPTEYLHGQGFETILVVVCPLSAQIDSRA